MENYYCIRKKIQVTGTIQSIAKPIRNNYYEYELEYGDAKLIMLVHCTKNNYKVGQKVELEGNVKLQIRDVNGDHAYYVAIDLINED